MHPKKKPKMEKNIAYFFRYPKVPIYPGYE